MGYFFIVLPTHIHYSNGLIVKNVKLRKKKKKKYIKFKSPVVYNITL